jgi:peptide/nickel transport system substrate-binding protein
VTLVKNPNYWQEGLPYLDGIEIRPVPDTDSRYASIENGDFDVNMGAYQPELYKAVRNDNLRVYFGEGNGSEYIYFNHTRAPFDDRRMREAVVRGIDTQAMAATQFQGDMAQTKEWFGPDSPFASKEAQDAWPKFDLEAAKKLVADYVADGGSANVVYKTTNASNRVAFAQFLQAQMKEIGITMEVQPYDLAQYASAVIRSNDFQFAGWVGGPVDNPYPNLHNLAGTGGTNNYGLYSNPEVDELLTTALETTDQDERTEAYKQVSLLINEDIGWAWTNRGYLSHITQTNVYGIDRTLNRALYLAETWKDE